MTFSGQAGERGCANNCPGCFLKERSAELGVPSEKTLAGAFDFLQSSERKRVGFYLNPSTGGDDWITGVIGEWARALGEAGKKCEIVTTLDCLSALPESLVNSEIFFGVSLYPLWKSLGHDPRACVRALVKKSEDLGSRMYAIATLFSVKFAKGLLEARVLPGLLGAGLPCHLIAPVPLARFARPASLLPALVEQCAGRPRLLKRLSFDCALDAKLGRLRGCPNREIIVGKGGWEVSPCLYGKGQAAECGQYFSPAPG